MDRKLYKVPDDSILGRRNSNRVHNENIKSKIKIAKEIRNYGTHLITIAYDKSRQELIDSVLIHNFLYNTIALLDGAIISITNGTQFTLPFLIRGIIENSFYLEWILNKNSDVRASYFHAFNLYKEYELSSFIADNPKGYAKKIGIEDIDMFNPIILLSEDFSNRTKKIKEYFHEYFPELFKKLKQGKPVYWYGLESDINSIKDVTLEIGRLTEYEILYSNYSKRIHAINLVDNLKMRGANGFLMPIRKRDNLETDTKILLTFTLRVVMPIIKKYYMEGLKDFSELYMNEWRSDYLR